jgi:phage terminase small subunit
MMKKILTAKQELFCEEYLVDVNATQAAIRAGYSEKTAYAIGAENLRKLELQKEIQKNMDKRSEKTEITQDYVLGGIKDVTEANKKDNPNAALKGFELMGKHLKLFTDKREISTPVKVALSPELQDLVDRITKRAEGEKNED